MTVLHLTEQDVAQLLDMPTTIAVMEEAFAQLAAGKADNVPRRRAHAPGIVLHSMSAAAEYLGLVGWKQYTTTRSGAKFHVGLYDAECGDLIALIDANILGQLRTGAVTGLAAKYLANSGVNKAGLFGSGWQAQSQLAAIAAACPLEQVRLYSRDPQRRATFAAKMAERLSIEVIPVDQPRAAVEGLPLVVTATTSHQPLFDGRWLNDGALVCAIGSNWLAKAEIDVTTIGRAARVICDNVAACQLEAGDLAPAVDAGVLSWDAAVELADVVAGNVSGRLSSDEIIVFKSVGLAIEDVALGAKVIELAQQAGRGTPLSL